jgi:tryptophan-rich sensory protein
LAKKQSKMGRFLYSVAIMLTIIWSIAFFMYDAGEIIHILLVMALIAFIVRFIQGGLVAKA